MFTKLDNFPYPELAESNSCITPFPQNFLILFAHRRLSLVSAFLSGFLNLFISYFLVAATFPADPVIIDCVTLKMRMV